MIAAVMTDFSLNGSLGTTPPAEVPANLPILSEVTTEASSADCAELPARSTTLHPLVSLQPLVDSLDAELVQVADDAVPSVVDAPCNDGVESEIVETVVLPGTAVVRERVDDSLETPVLANTAVETDSPYVKIDNPIAIANPVSVATPALAEMSEAVAQSRDSGIAGVSSPTEDGRTPPLSDFAAFTNVEVKPPVVVDIAVEEETPTWTEESVATGTPAVAATPVSSETTVRADASVVAGAPVAVETPVPVEASVVAETHIAVETPVAVESSVVAETHIAMETPVAVEMPEPTGKTIVAKVPVAEKTPESVEESESPSVPVAAMPIVESEIAPSVSRDASVVAPVEIVRAVYGAQPTVAPEAISPTEQLVAVAEIVAERILVTPSLGTGLPGEIVVQLKPEVLAGSTVQIAVDGKELAVTIMPTTTEVADLVTANQPVLVSALAERIDTYSVSLQIAATVATNVTATQTPAAQSISRKMNERN